MLSTSQVNWLDHNIQILKKVENLSTDNLKSNELNNIVPMHSYEDRYFRKLSTILERCYAIISQLSDDNYIIFIKKILGVESLKKHVDPYVLFKALTTGFRVPFRDELSTLLKELVINKKKDLIDKLFEKIMYKEVINDANDYDSILESIKYCLFKYSVQQQYRKNLIYPIVLNIALIALGVTLLTLGIINPWVFIGSEIGVYFASAIFYGMYSEYQAQNFENKNIKEAFYNSVYDPLIIVKGAHFREGCDYQYNKYFGR